MILGHRSARRALILGRMGGFERKGSWGDGPYLALERHENSKRV